MSTAAPPSTDPARTTWERRRLFSAFEGLLSDGTDGVEPTDVPVDPQRSLFGAATPALSRMLPESAERRTRHRRLLAAAGYNSPAAWENLAALRFVVAFLALLITGTLLLVAPPSLELLLLGAVVALPLVAWALPPLLLTARAAQRRIDIERGLPDVLDLLNMGVSQGLTVPQCLHRISREIRSVHPALATELQIVDRQTQYGSLNQALRNFMQRIDSPEVAAFGSLLLQSELTGTSISAALRDYSEGMRDSLRERADARANSASFWMLIPVTLCLMPSVFLFLLGPAIVQMDAFFTQQAGQLAEDRDAALDSLDQQPQIDLSRFRQN